MTETTESVVLETWSTPQCPFTIEYSRRMLDDIRLAVVDAFFSLPRGGAEIGGVLLGKYANGRVTILEYIPLECEHIFGPSFTLSPGDHGRLADIVSGTAGQITDLQPVGWYHSHTRSDIFLSDADLDIHNRYFPNPWQVALVLRPSTFQPVQAGFFFRELDGSVYSKGSYQEFALDPLPVGQVPRGMPAPAPQPIHRQPEPEGPVITLDASPVTAPAQPEPPHVKAVATSFTPAADPPPPPRATSLPPELPPLPRLELVPDPPKAHSEPVVENAREVAAAPAPVEEMEKPAATKEKYQPYTFEPWVPEQRKAAPPIQKTEPLMAHVEAEPPVVSFEPEPPAAVAEPPAAFFAPEEPAAPTKPALEFDGLMTGGFDSSVAPLKQETDEPVKGLELTETPAPEATEPAFALTGSASVDVPTEAAPHMEPAPAAESIPAALPEAGPEQLDTEPPNFLQMEPARPRRWLWVAGAAAVAIALGVGAYQQRAGWMMQLVAQVQGLLPQRAAAPVPPPAPLTLPLTASEEQGQLQIRWDSAAPAVTGARDGILQITDDGTTTDLPLDAAHLRSGVFTYVRFGEHVDARMTIQELDGGQVRAATSFYGALPATAKNAAADPAAHKENTDLAKENSELHQQVDQLGKQAAEFRQQRDELTQQTAKLKADLDTATASAKQKAALAQQNAELRQQLDDLSKQDTKLKADLETKAASTKQRAALAQQNTELRQQVDDLTKQTAKLKADLETKAAATKQRTELAQQNAALRQQVDDLTKQTAKLKADLAARAVPAKQAKEQAQPKDELVQQRDDLLIQIAKLKAELTAQTAGGKPSSNTQQNAEFSKERYQLVNRVSQLESDLAVAQARSEKLQRQLEDLKKSQTQRRLQNQSGDPTQ